MPLCKPKRKKHKENQNKKNKKLILPNLFMVLLEIYITPFILIKNISDLLCILYFFLLYRMKDRHRIKIPADNTEQETIIRSFRILDFGFNLLSSSKKNTTKEKTYNLENSMEKKNSTKKKKKKEIKIGR